MTLDQAIEVARSHALGPLRANASRIDREARWPEEGLRGLGGDLGGLVVPPDAGRALLGLPLLGE